MVKEFLFHIFIRIPGHGVSIFIFFVHCVCVTNACWCMKKQIKKVHKSISEHCAIEVRTKKTHPRDVLLPNKLSSWRPLIMMYSTWIVYLRWCSRSYPYYVYVYGYATVIRLRMALKFIRNFLRIIYNNESFYMNVRRTCLQRQIVFRELNSFVNVVAIEMYHCALIPPEDMFLFTIAAKL